MSEQDRNEAQASGQTAAGAARRVASLRELTQEAQPAHDLWPRIVAAIEAERPAAHAARGGGFGMRFAAGLAASVVLVAVGVWMGRLLPTDSVAPLASSEVDTAPAAIHAAFTADPQLAAARTRLLSEAEAKLQELPEADRARVAASLATIRRSMQEIEAALGREPANTLLQELLVNAYQDEMRVLTALSAARQET
jgi:hypothetical protein